MAPAYLKGLLTRYLSGTRAYFPLREMYQSVFNRAWVQDRTARQNFYSQFVRSGSLVFDVGANDGEYSYTFLRLGARVVALEPNPDCCSRLRTLGHKGHLAIRCEAVGEREGEVSLFVGDHSGHSTVSEEWMERVSQNDSGCRWNRTVKARMSTLDSIRHEHGTPDFVKIDVEGYESSVLRGMSFHPAALSFEFHAYSPEHVKECLILPAFHSGCSFNIVLGGTWDFVWPEWRDKEAVVDYTSNLKGKVFGDIYARFL